MRAARVTGTLAALLSLGSAFAFADDLEEQLPEPDDWSFRVVQTIDNAFTQGLAEKTGRLLEANATVEIGNLIATNEKAKLELSSSQGETLRLGSKTVAVFQADRSLRLKAGSALLHLPENSSPISFSSPICLAKFSGSGALLLEVTSNGGFKAIGLTGEPKILLADETERIVKPGNLTFLLENPAKFGPVLDIDLLTLISTSNLISGFEEPLACNDHLIRSMLLQRSRIRQRTRAFVGDAKDNQGFQLLNVLKNTETRDD